ncbi:cytochrome c oxidase assembly protein [Pseudogracilibacillus sp. SE30717A]|uniref:cytochrome c oxidase assembly protein n=1 Tax=Pseudogracilibacillus sp. SE30717A TaxID=3098293 RepID=UPI00300E29AB
MITVFLADQLTWNLPLLFIILVVSGFYIISQRRNLSFTKKMQPILFLTGVWLLYGMIGSPLVAFSYLSFSFHMIQMSMVFFIVPPLILLGIPKPVYNKIVHLPYINRLPHIITPKIALIIFAGLFLLYHLPVFLSFVSQFSGLQKIYLTVLFILSFRMFWPIASPDPNERLLSNRRKKYIWQSSMYIMPACMLFIISALLDGMHNPFLNQIAAHLCLPSGSSIQILPPPFNTKYDQMMAGAIMMGLHKFGLMVTCKLEKKCC